MGLFGRRQTTTRNSNQAATSIYHSNFELARVRIQLYIALENIICYNMYSTITQPQPPDGTFIYKPKINRACSIIQQH